MRVREHLATGVADHSRQEEVGLPVSLPPHIKLIFTPCALSGETEGQERNVYKAGSNTGHPQDRRAPMIMPIANQLVRILF